jgi:recA bacterial DNA recombination protein
MDLAMQTATGSLSTALARVAGRWGSAAIRLGNGDQATADGAVDTGGALLTVGALALAPQFEPNTGPFADPLAPLGREFVSTGFPELDAALGTGLPRFASAAFRGDLSSGKTTLALRCVAEAQAVGAICAWLDLGRAFDPLEAAARGVDLRWLLVVRARDIDEGFAIVGSLVGGRAVDLVVVDLPSRVSDPSEDQLRRLAARGQRSGCRLIVLEPASLGAGGSVAEATGVRLELDRAGWLRLGRDVVGQRTSVTVVKNRFGPPGRRVSLDIHYANGERAVSAHRFAEPSID